MRMRTLVVAVLTLAGCAGEDEGPEEDGLPTPDTLSWELAELDPAGVPVDLAEDGSVLLMKPRLAGFLLWEGGDARELSGLRGHTARFCPRRDATEAHGS